jgi:hypothetical protein
VPSLALFAPSSGDESGPRTGPGGGDLAKLNDLLKELKVGDDSATNWRALSRNLVRF